MMREIEINGSKIKIRGLVKREIFAMKDMDYPIDRWGIDIAIESQERRKKTDAMFEAVLAKGTDIDGSIDLNELTPGDEHKLFAGIIAETFGSAAEEKNSLTSGQADQTKTS